jgi:hypothetical protein
LPEELKHKEEKNVITVGTKAGVKNMVKLKNPNCSYVNITQWYYR